MPGKDGQSGNAMTPSAASRIQSGQANSGGDMGSGGFAARAQGAAARNENTSYAAFGGNAGGGQGGANQGQGGANQGQSGGNKK